MNLPWLDAIKSEIGQAIAVGKLGHAPLIHGPMGSGKRSLAQWLVARLLCTEGDGPDPCGLCRSCGLLPKGVHPDHFVLTIDQENPAILVDPVREFVASLALTPALSPRRTGLIVPAEAMNRNAANALLKTLEEPSQETWLVLVSDQPDYLPATIRSRCQRVPVALPAESTAERWLAEQIPGSDPDQRALALELADGAPLVAAGWLKHSGLSGGLEILDTLLAILEGRADGSECVGDWQAEPEATWTWLGRWSAALLQLQLTGSARVLGDRLSGVDLQPQAAGRLLTCWEGALEGRRLARKPIRHELLLHQWLLQWSAVAISD